MALGVYVHIPYCLQRCRYCDFTTFEQSEIRPPEDYLQLVLTEIRSRADNFDPTELASLYFGGGTPSIIPAEHIVAIIDELANAGFNLDRNSEVTIEINPATVDEEKFRIYCDAGINRFSVGAQTFDDGLLALCGRRHNSADTHRTLELLTKHQVNYSFDLLFALPTQTIEQLSRDLEIVRTYDPPHLSAYCLTVPSGHPMALNRPSEANQIQMFDLIHHQLSDVGLRQYEISNYSKPGRESAHNLLYWSDQSYWGIGLSAHSYRAENPCGQRFWNPASLDEYERQVHLAQVPERQREALKLHEALTDFCHTSLRRSQGLVVDEIATKFGSQIVEVVRQRVQSPILAGLIKASPDTWTLSPTGVHLSNQVFLELTFSPQDLPLSGPYKEAD